MLDPGFRKWMNKQIVLEPWLSQAGDGESQYDDSEMLDCYVEERHKMVGNVEGEEVVSTMAVYVEGTSITGEIQPKDRVTLENSNQPPILAVEKLWDEHGNLEMVVIHI